MVHQLKPTHGKGFSIREFGRPFARGSVILLAFATGVLYFHSSDRISGTVRPQETFAFEKRPFNTMQGLEYELSRPWYHMETVVNDIPPLLASPEVWLERLMARLEWLDSLTVGYKDLPRMTRAKNIYLQAVEMHTSGLVYGSEEGSVSPKLGVPMAGIIPLNREARGKGDDWTYLGMTMTGSARLGNVKMLLEDVFQKKVQGDYIETGVWRGGSSIFARAVILVHNEGHRMSYVCDSFRGLPPGDKSLHPGDAHWDGTPYLEVPAEIVAGNFRELGLLDPHVVFAKGFFNETMPPLATQVHSLAVMRLDGDMYESTVDVLYHMYDKLSIGGYVIMDDWFGFPARTACEDFFRVHGFNPQIVPIDGKAVYWKKTEHVDVQFWRYKQSRFKE